MEIFLVLNYVAENWTFCNWHDMLGKHAKHVSKSCANCELISERFWLIIILLKAQSIRFN